MFFRRPSTPPPEANSGIPTDAVVIIIPRVWLDRICLLAIALALGSTVTVHAWKIFSTNDIKQPSSKL